MGRERIRLGSRARAARGPPRPCRRLVLHGFVRLRPTEPALFPVVEHVGRVVARDPAGVVYLALPHSVWRLLHLAASLAASKPPPRAPRWGRSGGGSGGGGAAGPPPRPPLSRCYVGFVLGAYLDAMDVMHTAVAGVRMGPWRRAGGVNVETTFACGTLPRSAARLAAHRSWLWRLGGRRPPFPSRRLSWAASTPSSAAPSTFQWGW